jgi:hypothetical protein
MHSVDPIGPLIRDMFQPLKEPRVTSALLRITPRNHFLVHFVGGL